MPNKTALGLVVVVALRQLARVQRVSVGRGAVAPLDARYSSQGDEFHLTSCDPSLIFLLHDLEFCFQRDGSRRPAKRFVTNLEMKLHRKPMFFHLTALDHKTPLK